MPGRDDPPVMHSNRYTAASACRHCEGVVRHLSWCVTQNSRVNYAYQVLAEPYRLSIRDGLILHALGAVWASQEDLPG
jgi:hypothetical protein